MNNTTCAQCDCVAGCQANPNACPNLTAQPVKIFTVCFGTPEQRMAMLEKSLPKYDTRIFSNLSNQAHGFAKPAEDAGDLTDLYDVYMTGFHAGKRSVQPIQPKETR